MDRTAIVILNWNGSDMLRRFLPSVMTCSGTARVYVADNASTDDSMQMLAEKFPDVGLIPLEKNYGFAEGYNRALAQVDAEYYVLLNSDVEVTPGWIAPLTRFMDNRTDVAACQPKLLSALNRDSFEYAGACGGYIDKYGYPFCRGRIFNNVEQDSGQYDSPAEITWATGACLMVRADDWRRAGGLDSRFFAHNEEIDFCWRLKIAGRKVYAVPQSVVYHVGGATLSKDDPMKTYLNFRNNLTMLYKCLPESELRCVLRVRALLDFAAAVKMLVLDRNIGAFKAVLRGRRDFKRWRHDFDADRIAIHGDMSKEDTSDARCPFSLLYQYYMKGRKTFDALPH